MNQEELDTILAEYLMAFGKEVLFMPDVVDGEVEWIEKKTHNRGWSPTMLYLGLRERMRALERS